MTINFLYRSTKENSPLNIRMLFRHNNKDYVIGAKTRLLIYPIEELKENNNLSAKKYWKEQHNLTRTKDAEIINKQAEVNNEIKNIKNHLIKAFNDTNINQINKQWLAKQLDKYYNPNIENKVASNELIKNIDLYLISNRHLSTGTIKQYHNLKNNLTKYETEKGILLYVKDINQAFKNNYEKYSLEQNYSANTISRVFKRIKTICNYAKRNGIETSLQLEEVKTKPERVTNTYLTFEDLKKIGDINPNKLTNYLKNAKDWLIISCYTGQRVSDFMRFTKEMIRVEKGKSLLEFTQKKTNKIMTIPIHPEVLKILKLNNGEFPKPISDQKYNQYIKEVCKIAGLNEILNGKKREKTELNQLRNIKKKYEKWELVSSHIGRRSFATNYYGGIPTPFLMAVTGHHSEQTFLSYIGKSNKDLALEIANYF